MGGIYYKLQFKTELDNLIELLKNSQSEGFYVPFKFFDANKSKKALKEIFLLLNKKLIITNDSYKDLRPDLRNIENIDNSLMDEKKAEDYAKKIEDNKKKMDFLSELANNKQKCEQLIKNEYNKYREIKEFLIKRGNGGPLDEFLFEGKNDLNILEFEFPFIVIPQDSISERNDYIKKIQDLCIKLNHNFNEIQLENQVYIKSYTTFTFSKDDLKNRQSRNKLLSGIKKFENVILWIVDCNELKLTKEEMCALINFLDLVIKLNINIILKFDGIFLDFIVKSRKFNNIKSVIRAEGYPGLNVNIPAQVSRSKRLFDPEDGDFLNLTSIAVKEYSNYNCDCKICKEYSIKNYKDASELYLNPSLKNK